MKASPPGQEKARPIRAKPNNIETGIASFNLGAAWDGGETIYGERQSMLTVHVERKHASPPLQTWRTDQHNGRKQQLQRQTSSLPTKLKEERMENANAAIFTCRPGNQTGICTTR
ncbi:hypothetical protein OIU77_025066 [Salix suchowensis]|uniref:Uncharacterized protein n=1 Tax=Salix suchowensis TaxID=1278906 RepID=A0ABQ9BVR6_9ROSI|nr:hypothetical protein OIU77_025066 [Salix suchowensis]